MRLTSFTIVAMGSLFACENTKTETPEDAAVDGDGNVIHEDGGAIDAPDAPGDAPPDGQVIGTANKMFVTSTTQTGSLGGLAGADAICAMRASSAGLTGTYVAYLSTSTVNAKDRLGTARGWVRTDGKPFADTVADIAAGNVFYPPRVDEGGIDLAASTTDALTGTDATGAVVATKTCTDYTSNGGSAAYGTPSTGGSGFSYNGTGVCSVPRRLYCFGVDEQAIVTPPGTAGHRRAFVAYWPPGSGRPAADAACQAAAGAASITGTFKALIGTSTDTAASRFSGAGTTWVRHDGVEYSTTAAALLAGQLLTPIQYEANGNFAEDAGGYVMTGGKPDLVPPLGNTCKNWSSTDIMDSMRAGTITSSSAYAFDRTGVLCGTATRAVYCLQE